ncbi:hypothetical protein POM88_027188 [Heracleum sosnowskyi]|uniref:PDZ domain-containing protein n=1 Tax=Heracleum sosnowskyi TaxID=360622 RepID=A0AAD8I8I0_9APIA|nr:hypothetical protein POM88_027188 [Heracleum sosnowskyi]
MGSLEPRPTSGPKYLSPWFPERKETLSLDDGFDQTPVLKEILGHYNSDCMSSAKFYSALVSLKPYWATSQWPLLNSTAVNRKKLRMAYSTIAPSVVSISSFVGLERKIECSGVIIDWRSSENEATILTSARLLLTPKISDFFEFHIIVRMVDGTLLLAKEDRVDYYYNLLTLKVKSTVELSVVDLKSRQADIVDGMHVIALGRSFYDYALCDYSGKLYLEYPKFGCNELLTSTCCTPENCCEGGPLINDTGNVVGVNFCYGFAHPLPISVIIECLEMWRSASTVLRPWVGMSVVDANQLSYKAMEKSNMSLEDSYVVVTKVYGGSLAEKNNVRSGDLVATLNGTIIHSAKQYSQLFLSETSRATCGNSGQQNFTVVINPFNRRIDNISIEADYVSVEDKRFFESWIRYEDNQWDSQKFGSQKNPAVDWMYERGKGLVGRLAN